MSRTKKHIEKGKSKRYWQEVRTNFHRLERWSPRVMYDWEELFGEGSWGRHCLREWREDGEDRAERKRIEAKIHLRDHLKDVEGEYFYWKNRTLSDIFEEEDRLEFLRGPCSGCKSDTEWDW